MEIDILEKLQITPEIQSCFSNAVGSPLIKSLEMDYLSLEGTGSGWYKSSCLLEGLVWLQIEHLQIGLPLAFA